MNQKVTANEIQKKLLNFARGNNDIVIPNFYYGLNECDVFRITGSDIVIEYEIKISRSDFFADFKKGYKGNLKHDRLKSTQTFQLPNRFFFVVPKGLVSIDEVPEHCGLIYYEDYFSIVKNARLLHKVKFTNYRSISFTLAFRDSMHRSAIARIRNTDFDKEMSKMKRELDQQKKLVKEMHMENQMLKLKNGGRLFSS